ncbi:MAG: phage tail tape measure protein [Candidatus Competibacter sp.]
MGLPETGVRLVAENETGFTQAMGRADDAVERFGQGADGATTGTIAFGTAIGNLATGAITAVGDLLLDAGQAAGAFLGDSIMKAADLEAQMSGVAAVLGVSNDELQGLKDLVVDLGIDPTLKVSATEAAGAIEMLAQNGLSMEQIMDGAARATIFLSNATGGDFVLSAGLMTDAATIFNVEGEHMMDVVDGVTAVANASKFGIEDYALALANGGAVAASSGVEFADFNTVIAAIAPQFSSGQTAGTAFKNLLLRLVPNTDAAAEAMEDLGLITEDGANAFFDAEGNMKSMSEITGLLQGALSGLSEEQRLNYLRTIFGNDAMGAAIGLAELGQEEFDALAASMAEVDSGEAAATRVDNFAGKLDILKGVVEAVQLKIGDYFLPVLTTLAEKVSAFVDENADGFIAFFEKGATFVETFVTNLLDGEGLIDSFVTALGSLGVDQETIDTLGSVAETIGTIVTAIATFVSEHAEAFKGAFVAIGAVLVGGGIVAAISTIGSVLATIGAPVLALIGIAALLGAAWGENWFGIRDAVTQAWENTIKPALTELWNWLQVNIPIAIQAVSDYWNTVLLPALQTAWAYINDNVIPVLTQIGLWLQTNIPIAIQAASDYWNMVLLPALQTAWAYINDNVVPVLTNIVTWLQTNIPVAIQTVSDFWNNTLLPALQTAWAYINDNILPIFGSAQTQMEGPLSSAIDALARVWTEVLKPALEAVWSFINNSVKPLFEALANVAKAVLGAALEVLEGILVNTVMPALESLWSYIDANIVPVLKDAWADATEAVKEGMEALETFIDESIGPTLEWLRTNLLDPLVSSLGGISSAIQGVIDWLGTLADKINSIDFGLLEPGSPTPLEIGLWGIHRAMGAVATGMSQLADQTDVAMRKMEPSFVKSVELSANMMTVANDMLQPIVRPVASADQIARQSIVTNTDRSLTVNYESNNSWRPVADRDELMYLLGAYAN